MGTMIQRFNWPRRTSRRALRTTQKDLKGSNDLLVLTRPDVISQTHEQYPGSQRLSIIRDNTFGCHRGGTRTTTACTAWRWMNLVAARLAPCRRQVLDAPARALWPVPGLAKTASIS